VCLYKPTVWNEISGSPYQYYGIEGNYVIEQVRHFDALKSKFVPGILGFAVGMSCYGKALKKVKLDADLIYVRCPLLLKSLLGKGIPVALELHELPRFRRGRFVKLCNKCKIVVCLTSQMQSELIKWGVDKDLTIVEGDAVWLEPYDRLPRVDQAKIEWSLPTDRPVVGYVGSFVTRDKIEKGAGLLIEALSIFKLNRNQISGFLVGHPDGWLNRYKSKATNLHLNEHEVHFHSRIPPAKVPLALAACNVLVYPAPKSSHPYFQRDTSPLKLFEYLAAGRPIVCADIPPVHDLVGSDTVTFFEPGNPDSLTKAILEVLGDEEMAKTKVRLGRKRAEEHTWKRRMERIIAAIT